MDRLKPCPFCGGAVSMTFNGADNQWYVYHEGAACEIFEPIGIDGYFCKTEEEAAEAWNRRADYEDTGLEPEEIAKLLRETILINKEALTDEQIETLSVLWQSTGY